MPQVRVWEEMAVQRIDDLLESYMGIRDSDLGENKHHLLSSAVPCSHSTFLCL